MPVEAQAPGLNYIRIINYLNRNIYKIKTEGASTSMLDRRNKYSYLYFSFQMAK